MKHIIVTGSSRGIGFELVKILARQGHSVLALSRKSQSVIELGYENVSVLEFDLQNDDNFSSLKRFIEEKWKKVDILINNAGLLINKPFEELTKNDFQRVYQTNVFAVSQMIQTVLPFLSENAHIVNISSMGGVQGSMKFAGLAAYSSSKGALITLTELLAEEYKHKNWAFNVLALGAVQTEMLEEAFPDLQTEMTAVKMAEYIANFALTAHEFFNGKLIQVANTTP